MFHIFGIGQKQYVDPTTISEIHDRPDSVSILVEPISDLLMQIRSITTGQARIVMPLSE